VARQAALVCRGLADNPILLASTDLDISAAVRVGEMVVTLTLAALRDLNWLIECGLHRRQLAVPPAWLHRLGDRLDGAADYQDGTDIPSLPEVILTRPREPSKLVEALAEIGAPSTYWTRDGFVHLAAQACKSLRIMTPFIDPTGTRLVTEMFNRTAASHCLLILRPNSSGQRPWLQHLSGPLPSHVIIKEYWHETVDRDGTARLETFHAKVISADDRLAYVGSSNFVSASLDRSLECGVLLRDREVRTVAALLDAVERISSVVTLNKAEK